MGLLSTIIPSHAQPGCMASCAVDTGAISPHSLQSLAEPFEGHHSYLVSSFMEFIYVS
jgi:hypothetical protein